MPKTKRKSKQVPKNQINNDLGLALVEIEWIDSAAERSGGWHDVNDVRTLEPLTCFTCGYVLKNTDDYIIIINSMGGEGALGHIVIPHVAINKIWIIKDEKEIK